MQYEPVHKRKYHAFLSHASKDKATFVEGLYGWFSRIAEIPVWYDREAMQAGASFATYIAESIPKCRSMIIVLSKSSIASGWVQKEYEYALNHQMQYKKFKIIPVLIDDSEPPGFLENLNHIKVQDNQLDIEFLNNLLRAMYNDDTDVETNSTQDVYVSRTWRDDESVFADKICRGFMDRGFRLVGDAEDQSNFEDSKQRVKSIVSSCGGMLAILPYRADESDNAFTSKYILEEIEFARTANKPYVLFAERGVVIPEQVGKDAAMVMQSTDTLDASAEANILLAINTLQEQWRPQAYRQYVFYATSFDEEARNESVRRTIQRVTSMRCIIGEDVRVVTQQSVQEEIADMVRKAFLVVGDVSGGSVNTLIEMGIARGARVPYYMVAAEPRQHPIFMFQDGQIFYYKNAAELLGRVHKLVYPFRRRILNYEL